MAPKLDIAKRLFKILIVLMLPKLERPVVTTLAALRIRPNLPHQMILLIRRFHQPRLRFRQPRLRFRQLRLRFRQLQLLYRILL